MSVTCANGHTNLDGMAFCEECGVELTLTIGPGRLILPPQWMPLELPRRQRSPRDRQPTTPGSADTGDTMSAAASSDAGDQSLISGGLPGEGTPRAARWW